MSAYLAPKGLRELRNWATKVKADFVVNIVQPGRFITIERGLTFHIRERRADGQLLGIFIDDRRDPKERVTSLAEYGEIVETGTRHVPDADRTAASTGWRAASIDPDHREVRALCVRSVALRRRAAARRASACASAICGTSHSPMPDDPTYKQIPTHFRAELHDRLAAPIYPIAFTVLCFAILGAPRTSRQSREMSIIMTIVADRRAAPDRLCLQRGRGAERHRGLCACCGIDRARLRGRRLCDRARRGDRAAGVPDAASPTCSSASRGVCSRAWAAPWSHAPSSAISACASSAP